MNYKKIFRWRLFFVLGLLSVALIGLVWRLVDLNILNRSFLLKQSKARILRHIKIPAYRGMITDRLGSPLAISAPVESVWVNPKLLKITSKQIIQLAKILNVSPHYIQHRLRHDAGKGFLYLKRSNPPVVAGQVNALQIPGVFTLREYKRYYPEGEVTSHVVGLTNVDDQGQEGLELAYEKWLGGFPGEKEVIKDRLGHVISNIALLKDPQQGHELVLSLDHRIQYLAYNELKKTVDKYHAKSGSIVVLDVKTGEILAMVNQPTYNPNRRPKDHDGRYRNRAVTDMFEPGSTIKAFNIALALQSNKYKPTTTINTNPGRMKIGGYTIKDDGLNHGVIDLTQVLQKSSNIGAAKILLSMPPQNYWNLLQQFGFGQRTLSSFPGETAGRVVPRSEWYPSVVATLAYGYGLAVTTLQLAHAYAILANHGVKVPVTFLRQSAAPTEQRVISAEVADTVISMLRSVVEQGGTGTRAKVPGYTVAGKTGTAYIANSKGYDRHRYIANFVGVAPATDPKLVVAVVVRNPKGQHFGGLVAAPAFSHVMSGALRILDVAPDDIASFSHK